MMAGKPIMLLLGIVLVTCGTGTSSLAQKQFKDTKVGDWTAIENAWKYREQISGEEAGAWASTGALNGRYARLGIGSCSRYSVYFSFDTDAEFDGPKDATRNKSYSELGGRIAYTRVLPSDTLLDTTFLHGGDSEGFYYPSEEMIGAAKFLICPTKEEGPRCLTFSLKGVTAALKMVCPKR